MFFLFCLFSLISFKKVFAFFEENETNLQGLFLKKVRWNILIMQTKK